MCQKTMATKIDRKKPNQAIKLGYKTEQFASYA